MPAISVIVPVYKVEPYLRRCVDSLLSQSFSDFELILVDDGSPDGCGVICDEYAAQDARVHVIHQKNGGLSAARNAGIDWAFAHSDSRWLAFVDSDDAVSPDYLRKMYEVAEQHQAELCVSDFQSVFIDGGTEQDEISIPFRVCSGRELLEEGIMQANWHTVLAWNKLYRKELFAELRFPAGYINEDEAVIHRVLGGSGTVVFLPDKLYYYYRRADSIMGAGLNIKRTDVLSALSDRVRYAARIHCSGLYSQTLRGWFLAFREKYYPLLREKGRGTVYPRRVARATRAILPDLLRLSYWTRREKLDLILFSLFPHLQLAASRRRERKKNVAG